MSTQKQLLLAMRQQKAVRKKRQVDQILSDDASAGVLARVAPKALETLEEIKEEHQVVRGTLSKRLTTVRHGYGVETTWVNRTNRQGGGKLFCTTPACVGKPDLTDI